MSIKKEKAYLAFIRISAGSSWYQTDQKEDFELMAFKAVKKGQLQTAAQILDSLGKVIGESVETVNIQAPELSIRVEPKN